MPVFPMEDQTHERNARTISVLEEIYQTAPSGIPTATVKSRQRRAPRVRWDRFAPILTVAIGLLAVGVGVAQMRGTLVQPQLRLLASSELTSAQDLTQQVTQSFASALAAAPGSRDTDGDGLLDAEEQDFGTSAYLEDTDSDGQLDGAEIDAGSDPTCPAGQTCQPKNDAAAATNPPPTAGGSSPPPSSDAQPPNGSFDVGPLRQQLQGAGVPEGLLDTVSDEQLSGALNQELERTIGSLSGEAAGSTPGAAGATVSPQQLRELLRQQGVSEEMLQQYTDEELQQIATEVSTAVNE